MGSSPIFSTKKMGQLVQNGRTQEKEIPVVVINNLKYGVVILRKHRKRMKSK